MAVQIIEAGRVEKNYWRDLWRYRELFQVLAWRDVAVRYKQTVIGVMWAVIRPLLTMVILTVVFGRIAKLPSEACPVSSHGSCGNASLDLFLDGIVRCIEQPDCQFQSHHQGLLSAADCPNGNGSGGFCRFCGELWTSGGRHGLVSLCANMAHFLSATACPNRHLSVTRSWLVGTALNVKYRDFRYVIPFVVQFGLYVSPVAFSSNIVPPSGGCFTRSIPW